MPPTHYEILGIPETASDDAIKAAWHKRAQETHPDKGGRQEDFVRAKEAYDVLRDASSRQEYDRERRGGGSRAYAPFESSYARQPDPASYVRPTATKEREADPNWWRDLYERQNQQATHQRRRTREETRQAYYEDQDVLEGMYGTGASWDRTGTMEGDGRPRNVFRSRFRNNGKVG